MTEIYRKFDPQTRKLSPVIPSVAGGVKGDSNSLRIHISYPTALSDQVKTKKYLAYLAFDVQAYDNKQYCFSSTTSPVFDGFTFTVPNEVMSKVRSDKLGYQLLLINADATQDEAIYSNIDYLMVMNGLDVSVALDPSLTAYVAKLNEKAIVTPVVKNGDLLTFTTTSGAETTLDLDITGRLTSNLDAAKAYSDTKYAEMKVYVDENDEVLKELVQTRAESAEKSSKLYTDAQISALDTKISEQDLSSKEYVDQKVEGLITSTYVDTKISDLRSEFTGIYTVKGSKETVNDLPADPSKGDVWNILGTGANYVWTGENWDKLSETVDLSSINENISAIKAKNTEQDAQIKANKVAIDDNKVAIDTNTVAIATNTADIATNKADIAENTANITQATGEIRTLKNNVGAVSTELSGLKLGISTYGTRISAAEGRLDNLEGNYATKKYVDNKRFVYHQENSDVQWVIQHNLGCHPLVITYSEERDSLGNITIGGVVFNGVVEYIDENNLIIMFNAAVKGYAIMEA